MNPTFNEVVMWFVRWWRSLWTTSPVYVVPVDIHWSDTDIGAGRVIGRSEEEARSNAIYHLQHGYFDLRRYPDGSLAMRPVQRIVVKWEDRT